MVRCKFCNKISKSPQNTDNWILFQMHLSCAKVVHHDYYLKIDNQGVHRKRKILKT